VTTFEGAGLGVGGNHHPKKGGLGLCKKSAVESGHGGASETNHTINPHICESRAVLTVSHPHYHQPKNYVSGIDIINHLFASEGVARCNP